MMHYFKDKQGNVVAIEDRLWKAVQNNEPWLKETDKHGNLLNAPLTQFKEVKITEVKPEPLPVIPEVKNFETLKVEKLNPNVKTTRVKRKAKATKAR